MGLSAAEPGLKYVIIITWLPCWTRMSWTPLSKILIITFCMHWQVLSFGWYTNSDMGVGVRRPKATSPRQGTFPGDTLWCPSSKHNTLKCPQVSFPWPPRCPCSTCGSDVSPGSTWSNHVSIHARGNMMSTASPSLYFQFPNVNRLSSQTWRKKDF